MVAAFKNHSVPARVTRVCVSVPARVSCTCQEGITLRAGLGALNTRCGPEAPGACPNTYKWELQLGHCCTPLQSMALGAGIPTTVEVCRLAPALHGAEHNPG